MNRTRSGAVGLLAIASLVCLGVACSAPTSSPSPEPEGASSEALGPRIPWKCESNDECSSSPNVTSGPGGFDTPVVRLPNGRCALDTSFADQLVALGCQDPMYYYPGTGGSDSIDTGFNIAWCPKDPVDTAALWEEIDACNTCTGPQPAFGWVLIAWSNPECLGTFGGGQPGGGCHSASCIKL